MPGKHISEANAATIDALRLKLAITGQVAGSFTTVLPTGTIATDKVYLFTGTEGAVISAITWHNGDAALYNGSAWTRVPFQSLLNYSKATDVKYLVTQLAYGVKAFDMVRSDGLVDGYLNAQGVIAAGSTYNTSEFIEVTPGMEITVVCYVGQFISYLWLYNSTQTKMTNQFRADAGNGEMTYTITIPVNCKYIRVSSLKGYVITVKPTITTFRKDADLYAAQYTKDSLIGVTFDSTTGYLGADGVVAANAGYYLSQYMPIIGGVKISVIAPTYGNLVCYDSQGLVVGALGFPNGNSTPYTYIVPIKAVMFRMCCTTAQIANVQISITETLSWFDYRNQINAKIDLPALFLPNRIYTVASNIYNGAGILRNEKINNNRATIVYLDHLLALNTTICKVANGFNDKIILDPLGDSGFNMTGTAVNANVKSLARSFTLVGDDYRTKVNAITQYSTLGNVGATTKVRILGIGNSIMGGTSNDTNIENIDSPKGFMSHVKLLFEMDKLIDVELNAGDGSKYDLTLIGCGAVRDAKFIWNQYIGRTVPNPTGYKAQTITYKDCSHGLASWRMYDFLMSPTHFTVGTNFQGLADLAGLVMTYTGTDAQKNLLYTTPIGKYAPIQSAPFLTLFQSNYTGITNMAAAVAKYNDLLDNPQNAFYNKTKALTGDTAFDFALYLTRFRTMDANGVRLASDAPTKGTLVTDVNAYNVCEPTHVLIDHGDNDRDYASLIYTGTTTMYKHLHDLMYAEIRSALPTAKYGVSMHDAVGTMFPDFYPEWENATQSQTDHTYFKAMNEQLMAWEDAVNNRWYVPVYFVSPTAYGWTFMESSPLSSMYYPFVNKRFKPTDSHPNLIHHAAAGYQIYAWIKYTLSL